MAPLHCRHRAVALVVKRGHWVFGAKRQIPHTRNTVVATRQHQLVPARDSHSNRVERAKVRGVLGHTLAVLQVRRDEVPVRAARVEHLRVERERNVQHGLLVHVREETVVVVWGVRFPQRCMLVRARPREGWGSQMPRSMEHAAIVSPVGSNLHAVISPCPSVGVQEDLSRNRSLTP